MNTNERFDFSALFEDDDKAEFIEKINAAVDELQYLLTTDLMQELSPIAANGEIYFPLKSVIELISHSSQDLRKQFRAWYAKYLDSSLVDKEIGKLVQRAVNKEKMLALMEESLAMHKQILEKREQIFMLKRTLSQKQ